MFITFLQDEKFDAGLMDGAPYKRGLFAGSLRRYLFSEHLGLFDAGPIQGHSEQQPSHAPPTDAVDQGRSAVTWLRSALATASAPLTKADTGMATARVTLTKGDSTAAPTLQPLTTTVLESKPKKRITIKDIVDPVCDHFHNDVWLGTAQKNTKIYEEVSFSMYRYFLTLPIRTYSM